MTTTSSERIVICPRCQGDSVYAARNPYRPFCSERCKNLDFSAWASENYRIEAQPSPDDLVQEDASSAASSSDRHH